MKHKFHLDPQRGKFLGVCAGIAAYTGVDVTFVRVGAVVLTLIGGFPFTILAYFGAAWLAKPADNRDYLAKGVREWRADRNVELDRRLGAIETEAASQDSKLAREIEALR